MFLGRFKEAWVALSGVLFSSLAGERIGVEKGGVEEEGGCADRFIGFMYSLVGMRGKW